MLERIMKTLWAMHNPLRYLLTHVIIILSKLNKLDLSGSLGVEWLRPYLKPTVFH